MPYDSLGELKAAGAVTATGQATGLDLTTMAPLNRTLVARAVFTAVSGTAQTCALVIQHSSDNTTFTDLAHFDPASITATGEYFCPFQTKKQYVRVGHTIGGTSPSFNYFSEIGLSYP